MADDPGRAPVSEPSVEAAMAEVEWEGTPVGPPETWSPLLTSITRIMLASRFSMWLGWGPEHLFFYNDAYRRTTLGVKHPWALGRPARDVWEEIWPDIQPRIDAVYRGEATWDEALLLFLERSGYREETYHTFSYSPVTEADGTVAAILCVVSEDTERVIGERRLATLQQLASSLASSREEDEVYSAVASQLGANPYDLPYALVYVLDGAERAQLVATTGVAPGAAVAPSVVDVHDTTSWPVQRLLDESRTMVDDDVERRFGDVPTGAWDLASSRAIVVPLSQQGQSEPAGFLVAGTNPYRPADSNFVAFVELVAGQVAAGIANARAYGAERRRAEALAELDRAKTEFFSNVSHEFRTPLTLILGPAEDSLSDDVEPLSPAQAARLEVIRRNARRLRRMVNDMLDFARIEGGRLQAETYAVDLAELTSDIARSFAPAIERAGIGMVVDCPPLPRPVHVDVGMWEKILLNLLSNALKFTLEGEISVRVVDRGETVELTVADTGAGIPADDVPKLFERFYRSSRPEARSHEGTGIGLALVHELVQLHGGTVEVSSVEGRGSTFGVHLPYGTASPGTALPRDESAVQAYLDEALQWLPGEGSSAALERSGVGRMANASVLVVDDNPDIRRYVARILEPFWDVTTAPDGVTALMVVRERRPDLILTDVMMQGLDGFGLLEALREQPETSTIPVIFLSARAGEEAAVEGLDAGADDYLVKPFSSLELLARVRSNLELAAMRNQESAWRRALIESLDEAVIVMDSAGTVVEANAAFEHILGFSRSDLPYKPPFPWFPTENADARRELDELFANVLREGRFRGEVELHHRDGRSVVVDASVDSVVVDGSRRFVASFRDVTMALQRAERQASLARLGIRLAEAADVQEVQEAGLTELKRVFGAARAGIDWGEARDGVVPSEGPAVVPSATEVDAAGLPLTATEADTVPGSSLTATEADTVPGSSLTAPLDPTGASGVVWVAFDVPRLVDQEDRSLFRVLCGYFGQALRRAQLFDDNRTVATAMQRSILGPTDVPAGVAVRYLPAVQPLEVGGDWYDAVELPGDRLGLVVGDCVGRGLPAATVMGQLRSACRALLLQAQAPAEVVRALDAFAERIPGASCTTVFCAIVAKDDHTVRYCSAGHIPGVLAGPDGSLELLHQAGSVPLGVVPGVARRESSTSVVPGGTLLVCTDGLIERRDESLDVGIDRLVAAVRANGGAGHETFADRVMGALIPPGGQEDDVAVVVYRRQEMSTTLDIVVAADPHQLASLRRRLSAWFEALGIASPHSTDMLVAAGEAVSNAMEHGYRFDPVGVVAVSGRIDGGALEIRVQDRGRWRPPVVGNEERGRGLQIMEGLMDEVRLLHDDRGTTAVLRLDTGNAS